MHAQLPGSQSALGNVLTDSRCRSAMWLIAPQHTLHQISQWAPEILASAREAVLVDEQHIVFKTRVQVRFETQLDDDRVVMAVDVGVDAVEALEHVADEGRESFRKGDP